MLTTILTSFDTFVFIRATTTSVTLWVTSASLIKVPYSAGIILVLTIGKKNNA